MIELFSYYSSPELAPAGIILDAQLTLATPERLWFVTQLAVIHYDERVYLGFQRVFVPLIMLLVRRQMNTLYDVFH